MNKPLVDNRYLETELANFSGPPLRVATGKGTETLPCCCAKGMCITAAGPGPVVGPTHIGLLMLHVDEVGLYVPLSPDQLRALAVACTRTADFLDSGKGKQ